MVKSPIENGKLQKRVKTKSINQKYAKKYEKKNDNIMTPMTKTNEETNYISRIKTPMVAPPLKKVKNSEKTDI